MAKQRDGAIETLRGLAIILMVAGHVIGFDEESGMRVAEDSPFRHFYYSLQFLRLPLFTVISGWVYQVRPVGAGNSLGFLRGKARRLLLPMAAVGTIEFLMRAWLVESKEEVVLSDVWRIYLFSFDHFWFLQAIFLVFIVVMILEETRLLESPWLWALLLVLCIGQAMSPPWVPPDNLFSYAGYIYLLPFFVLGLGLGRFPALLRSSLVTGVAAVVVVVGLVYQQAHWYGFDLPFLSLTDGYARSGLLGMAIGLAGCTVLLRVRWETPWLAWLGHYAYGIYLFHVFGSAGSRMVATNVLGLETGLPLFLISLAFGLGVPIVIERMSGRAASLPNAVVRRASNAWRLAFLGLRSRAYPQPQLRTVARPLHESVMRHLRLDFLAGRRASLRREEPARGRQVSAAR